MKLQLIRLALVVVLVSTMVLVPPAAMAQGRSGGTRVTGDLSDGGKFKGTLIEPQFSFEDGQLFISGVLVGKATLGDGTSQQITQEFTKEVLARTDASTESVSILQVGEPCDILFLDIGPIFLDLLGLTVDLSEIILDINAVPGAGNLLGNLLCALLGLLNP